MRQLSLFMTLVLLLNSCSRSFEFQTYRDPKYPFVIKYLPNKMEADPFFEEDEHRYWVTVRAKFHDEFPDDYASEFAYDLYDVVIFQNVDAFEKFDNGLVNKKVTLEETELNGCPAILVRNKKDGLPSSYLLLTPGVYAQVWFSGTDVRSGNPDEISQQFSDRVKEYTYQMVKYLKWNQKIDTLTPEFQSWKKHIWEVLKTSSIANHTSPQTPKK